MSDRSEIAWTNATWNPVRGCTKVSAGCAHCYAETFAERFRGVKGHPYEQGFDVRLVPEALDLPPRWKKPRRIFVNSMSDLFHESVPDEFLLRVFDVIRRCDSERPGHVFQILSKRSARMQDFCARLRFDAEGEGRMWLSDRPAPNGFAPPGDGYAVVRALSHLWLGVSVENQAAADERIPLLLATPAAVRFLSVEPLLGLVDLSKWLEVWGVSEPSGKTECSGLDWVIVGGESGPKARPMRIPWAADIVTQCRAAGVPVFVKQIGAVAAREAGSADRKGGDMACWPPSLRVREFPRETR